MNDVAISVIRTVVASIIGYSLGWLARKGIEIDQGTADQLAVAMTAVGTGAYQGFVRQLEKKNPSFGWMLGYPKSPSY